MYTVIYAQYGHTGIGGLQVHHGTVYWYGRDYSVRMWTRVLGILYLQSTVYVAATLMYSSMDVVDLLSCVRYGHIFLF